jgi:hypothetical protein
MAQGLHFVLNFRVNMCILAICVRVCGHGMTEVLTERRTLRAKNMVEGDTDSGESS